MFSAAVRIDSHADLLCAVECMAYKVHKGFSLLLIWCNRAKCLSHSGEINGVMIGIDRNVRAICPHIFLTILCEKYMP